MDNSPPPQEGTPKPSAELAVEARVEAPSPDRPPRIGAASQAEKAEKSKREPAFYQRRKKRGNEICQILIRNGAVTPENVRKGLRIQEEQGGQIGRILVKMGACDDAAIASALLEQIKLQRDQGSINVSQAARDNPGIVGVKVDCSPALTITSLVLTDLLSLVLGALVGYAVNYWQAGVFRVEGLFVTAPAIILCILAFAFQGLYAAMARSPPDELAQTTTVITVIFITGGAVSSIAHRGQTWSLLAVVLWWLFSVTAAPIARAILRAKVSKSRWWGHPVIVLGAGKTGRLLVRILRNQPERGLKPVMLLDDDRSKHGTLRANLKDEHIDVRSTTQATTSLVTDDMRAYASDLLEDMGRPSLEPAAPKPRGMFAAVEDVPVVGDFALAPVLAARLKIRYAILAMPGVASDKLLLLTERIGGLFSHLLLIPDLLGFASLGVPAKDVGGVLGIEVRQQLLLPGPRLLKRAIDVVATTLGGLLILPIIALLALAIKIDSRGPIFYFQERLGRDGTRFRAAKFRSMYGDGEARLKAVLESDPKLRAEYEEFHKLHNDPRVTRVGRIVRKFSLDELPQLWNVVVGDMSLVGPRPYLEREIPAMEAREGIILRAPPGLTGLWQVSDRNSTGFAERVKMDVHYVRNWSPWLDIYILARTIGVVLKGTGV
jgi:lipopolysaccharide/colanic/teichoic acid biosynthesis glycosyltransferase